MLILNALWLFLLAHKFAAYWLLAVGIGQLPMPTIQSNGFYRWFFGVTQVLAANVTRGRIGVNGGANYDSTTGKPNMGKVPPAGWNQQNLSQAVDQARKDAK